MGKAKRRALNAVVDELSKHLVDKGLLIEAGWASLRAQAIPMAAPQEQLDEMRMAFFAGAQHLFGSIMGILDEDREPTEADLRRLDLIDKELRGFIEQFKLRQAPTEGSA